MEHDYKEDIVLPSVEKSLEHDYKEEILFCHQWRCLWSMTTRKRYCSAISGEVSGA